MKVAKVALVLGTTAAWFVSTTVVSAQGDPDPVIAALDAAIQSLKQQPNQFSLSVTVVGAMGVASGSGTGIKVEVRGGEAGSQTTGLVATATGAQVNIAQATADAALKQEAEKAVRLLTEIKAQLQSPKPDKAVATSKLAEFAKTYVAPVLKTVVEALVKKKLGL